MLRLAVRGLRTHAIRLGATALAVLLGVSFMVGTRVLGDTVKASFDEAFTDINQGVDAVVRSDTEVPSPFGDERARIDASVVGLLDGLGEVAGAAGQIRRPLRLIGPDGSPVGDPTTGPPTFGVNWVAVPELNPWELVEGVAPTGDTVVIDRRTSQDAGIGVGDRVRIELPVGTIAATVSGVATFGQLDNLAGAPAVILGDAEAQALLGEPGFYDWITLTGIPGLAQDELVAAITPELPPGTSAITGVEFSDETAGPFRDFIDQFTAFITAFGVIALFVGGFIIFNTFAVLVAQRTRELALLRAIGASRRQVLASVLGEAALVGVISAALGALAGVGLAAGLRQLLVAFGLSLPPRPLTLAAGAFVLPVVLGVAITAASAVVPAVRASRVAPVAALGAAARDRSARSPLRIGLGIVAAVGAGILVVAGLNRDGATALQLVGAGLIATFVAVTAFGPLFIPPLAQVLGLPLRAATRITGRLATENASRNPARTSATTAALTIGVGLVTVIAIAASSASASVTTATRQSFASDLIVQPDSFLGLSPEVAARLDALEEVSVATGLRLGFANAAGDVTSVLGVEPGRIEGLVDFEVTNGSLDDLGEGRVAISTETATSENLKVGDEATLGFADTGDVGFTVVAIYGESPLLRGGGYLLDQQTFDANVTASARVDRQVLVQLAGGVDPEAGRRAVEEAATEFPTAEVLDVEDLTASRAAQVDQAVALLYALLALSVLIALIGVVNTLLLSVYERTREIGLLRAVGTLRRQVSGMVIQEAVLIAVVGTVLGLAIGWGFGIALFSVLARAEPTFSVLAVPLTDLAVIVGLGALAGILAGLYPAWRAGRLNVLDAIATE